MYQFAHTEPSSLSLSIVVDTDRESSRKRVLQTIPALLCTSPWETAEKPFSET